MLLAWPRKELKVAKQQVKRNPREPSHNTGVPKQHPHMHPLHHAEADHRDMSMKDKYLGDGPHISMPDHQHELHHPHTDVMEKHKMIHTKKGPY
jgi:hypothetical protein